MFEHKLLYNILFQKHFDNKSIFRQIARSLPGTQSVQSTNQQLKKSKIKLEVGKLIFCLILWYLNFVNTVYCVFSTRISELHILPCLNKTLICV